MKVDLATLERCPNCNTFIVERERKTGTCANCGVDLQSDFTYKNPDNPREGLIKKCPYCAEEIAPAAKKCKHCGEFLDETLRTDRQTHIVQNSQKWSPGVAALLSLIIPGAGQIYKGQVIGGLVWLFVVPTGYFMLVVPGIVLHFLCIATAASGDPSK